MSAAPRLPVFGAGGMVASSQCAATLVGVDVLRRGGSAVDAAIATNAALSVIEPHMCGMGGDLFALVWDPKEQALSGLNASGRGPSGLELEELQQLSASGSVPGRGPLSITTPGAVDGWYQLHDRYGRLAMAEILEPAAELAERGVSIGESTAAAWSEAVMHLQADPVLDRILDNFLDTFTRNSSGPQAGDVMHNPALANTFRIVGKHGRDAFYEGEIADTLSTYLKSTGAFLSTEDLATHRSEWVQPISTRYRDVDVFELPPNGQGLCVLQMLNILENFSLDDFGRDDPRFWHAFIEAKKLAFEDRAMHYADPDTYDAPVAALADKRYAAGRQQLIDPAHAGDSFSAGEFALPGSDTTYLSAADADGMMVSLIQSIFSPFGSGLVAPGLGSALQSRGAGFNLHAEHPNCYAPGKRPFHTIIPGFACRDGQPWFSFGVMGADMQPQGQVQVLMNMLDLALDPQAAGDALRLRHDGGRQPNGQHMDGLGVIQYEKGFNQEVLAAMERMGHKLIPQKSGIAGFMGGYQGILRDNTRGTYVGATETRLDGMALGV